MRNILLTGLPVGPSRLDLTISPREQQHWLTHPDATAYDLTDREALARSRAATSSSMSVLLRRSDFTDLCAVVRAYLMACIPWPQETEGGFWTITCLPSTNRSGGHRRLGTLTINNVEALVIFEEQTEIGWRVRGFFNAAATLLDLFPGDPWITPGRYRSTGQVARVAFLSLPGLAWALSVEDAVVAARAFALGLMRRGRGLHGRHHDAGLADAVFLATPDIEDLRRAGDLEAARFLDDVTFLGMAVGEHPRGETD